MGDTLLHKVLTRCDFVTFAKLIIESHMRILTKITAYVITLFAVLSIHAQVDPTPLQTRSLAAFESNYPFAKDIKTDANGLSITLQTTPEMATQAFESLLAESGTIKTKSIEKNLMGAEGIVAPAISQKTIDLYYRIEPLSKKEKSQSRVTLFLAAGNHNFMDSRLYPAEIQAAQLWLARLPAVVEQLNVSRQLNMRQEELDALEKEKSKMAAVLAKTEKGLAKLDKNIAKLVKQRDELKAQAVAQQTLLDQQQEKINAGKETVRRIVQ